MSPLARFEAKYIPEPNSGCWLWLGGVAGHDQPRFWFEGEDQYAARVAWLLYHGLIPDDLHVLHKCDVTLCVNPSHLFLGTHLDNMQDMAAKGRGNGGPNPKLTAREVWEIKQLRGHITQRALGLAYGVSTSHVGNIQLGRER